MTDITQCPQCGTHFKITQEQRNAHQGLVRCGKCQMVFNAVENLYIPPPQQLDLPLDLEEIDDYVDLHSVVDPYADAGKATSQTKAGNDFSHISDEFITTPKRSHASPKQTKLYATGSLIIALIVLLQLAYLFRIEIAANLPGVKPALESICLKLNCTIPLPQKIDLISIESSELESDPAQANIITLHALLRSRAPYDIAFPDIELTLTDTLDNPIARRTFARDEYIVSKEKNIVGLPANREYTINLHLNTTDLKPSGYRLFLFYPR